MATTFTMPYLHPGQLEVMHSSARFKVLAAGRRWGKTMLGALACIVVGLQGGHAWWVGPTYSIAEIGWAVITGLAVQIPGAVIRKGERTVYFPGGGWVRVKSAKNPQTLRGEGLDLAILDEASYILMEAWTEVIRPSLTDRKGGAWFISTPSGHNWFYKLWQLGNRGQKGWASWRFPTAMSPFIDANEVEEAQELLPPVVFAQEYEADFIPDSGVVFRRIQDALYYKSYECYACGQLHQLFRSLSCDSCDAPIELEPLEYVELDDEVPVPEGVYYMGTDWGQKHDFTVNTVMTNDYTVVDIDRYNKVSWSIQRARLIALHEKWNNAPILAEANSIGWPNIEALQEADIPIVGFDMTLGSKTRLVHQGVLAFEENKVSIPNYDPLIDELYAFTARQLLSGWRYAAPEGDFDDSVISLILALEAVNRGSHAPIVAGEVALRRLNPTRPMPGHKRGLPRNHRGYGKKTVRRRPR